MQENFDKKNYFFNTSFLKSEILGIILQSLPFIICLLTFTDEQKIFWVIPRNVKVNIRPELISALFAFSFYGILVIRMGMFKKETVFDAIISVIATFLNVMVIASLFSVIISSNFKFAGIENFGVYVLVFGCVFSLCCMRTLSGYVFIIFLILAIIRLIDINSAMGFWGAIYIVFMGISLFLQIPDLKDFSNLLQEFKGPVKTASNRVTEDINFAKDDATEKINNMKSQIKSKREEQKSKKKENQSQNKVVDKNVTE